MPCIYKITHRGSGRVYVGLTDKPNKRWISHLSAAKRGSRASLAITRAMHEHGIEHFDFEILETTSTYEDAIQREIYWIAKLKKLEPGVYNKMSGGTGPVSHGHRAKMSAAHRGKTVSTETRTKISEAHQGKKQSIETIAKVSAALRGRKITATARANMSAALRGRKFSPEHCARLSAAAQRNKAKTGAAFRGRTLSPEHRAKLSAAAKRYRRNKAKETTK